MDRLSTSFYSQPISKSDRSKIFTYEKETRKP